ncbi:BlaI/MecI/CopY family transcriptional regulator [Lachnospiraceae bacterium NSJ-143]|nr:BlaI/MecI/CopY family transcriptional regulator [Lachnospiraceae bacterium NSJ-143]
MENLRLCDSDYRFMLVVWENAPVGSGELVSLCRDRLGWKKSTVYTAIKKMTEKGIIQNNSAVVSVIVPKERVQAEETDYFVERTFDGSFPDLLAAFLKDRKISDKEADEIKALIESHREG